MLQRILSLHPEIATSSEPWILLPLVYSLRRSGHTAEYNAVWAAEAIDVFVSSTPAGVDGYVKALSSALKEIYASASESQSASIFLDKTPRYYHIAREIPVWFPNQPIIFLWRHPLAVLVSVYKSWVEGTQSGLSQYAHDLLSAPRLMLDARDGGSNSISMRYEDLVRNPETELKRLLSGLRLDYVEGIEKYGGQRLERWQFGDQGAVYDRSRPDPALADRWRSAVRDPQINRLAGDYLDLLGNETVDQMGYDFDEAINLVADSQSSGDGMSLKTMLDF